MSDGQWHEDQAIGERALREHERRRAIDERLANALRDSGLNAEDAHAVRIGYAWAGEAGTRIVEAMRALEEWLKDGGAR